MASFFRFKPNDFVRFTVYLCTIMVLCYVTNRNAIFSLPDGMHNWAQSDRYALSVKYLDGSSFSSPRTFAQYTEDGRVGVEFPGIPFLSAKMAVAYGRADMLPFIYRSITCLLLSIGLSLAAIFLTESFISGFAAILLVSASPVLLFYSLNFLPDTVSLGFCIAGLGLFVKGVSNKKKYYTAIGLLLLAIAGLFKLTALLYVVAACLYLGYDYMKVSKQPAILFLLMFGIVLAGLVIWYDYIFLIKTNKDLWSVIFLGKSNPVKSVTEMQDVFKGVYFWRNEFYSNLHWYLFFTLLLFIIFSKNLRFNYRYFLTVTSLGIFSFLVLLGKQLINHDYYALTTFYPFLLICGISGVEILHTIWGNPMSVFMLGASLYFLSVASTQSYARHDSSYKIRNTVIDNNLQWLEQGAIQLDKAGIPGNANIFVLYDFAPNTSLVYFNRNGLVFNFEQMARKEPHLEYWQHRLNPSVFIVKNQWEKELFKDKPLIADTCERIVFDQFVVYRPKK